MPQFSVSSIPEGHSATPSRRLELLRKGDPFYSHFSSIQNRSFAIESHFDGSNTEFSTRAESGMQPILSRTEPYFSCVLYAEYCNDLLHPPTISIINSIYRNLFIPVALDLNSSCPTVTSKKRGRIENGITFRISKAGLPPSPFFFEWHQ